MIFKLKDTARKFRGWSLYKLAQELELDTKTVYGWSNGVITPTLSTLLRLCEILGCTPNDLLTLEKNLDNKGY